MIATNFQIFGFIIGYYISTAIVYTDDVYANDLRTKDLIDTDFYVCNPIFYDVFVHGYKLNIKNKIFRLMILLSLF